MDELEARLRAMMRRAAGQASPVIRHADLEVDPAARIIRQAGQKVEVSPREFAVLWALLYVASRDVAVPWSEANRNRSTSTAPIVRGWRLPLARMNRRIHPR